MIGPLHFQIAGCLLVVLALSHALFPRMFEWKKETAALSPLNRQVFYVHSFFIALAVLLNGLLFVFCADLLLAPSPLRNPVVGGIAVFWFTRLLCQLFVYDRRLWRGHALNTVIHVMMTGFWTYLVVITTLVIFDP